MLMGKLHGSIVLLEEVISKSLTKSIYSENAGKGQDNSEGTWWHIIKMVLLAHHQIVGGGLYGCI